NVSSPGIAGSACGAHFAYGMHKPAIPDRSQQKWKSEIEAENAGTQIAGRDRDRMARTERHVFIDPATLAQRNLALSAAVKVIEDRSRHAAFCDRAEISNADHAGRSDGAGGS